MMRAALISIGLTLVPASCQPIFDHGTHTDPKPCTVWVLAGFPTGDLPGHCTLNEVGLPPGDCLDAGGTPVVWGCEGRDF